MMSDRGSFIFLADLSRVLTIQRSVDFLSLASCETTVATRGPVRLITDLRTDIEGKHVLVVEDIVDTGDTIDCLMSLLAVRGPASLKCCALLSRPACRKAEVRIDYLGFEIPDVWVVGYGLDDQERYRALPYIGIRSDKHPVGDILDKTAREEFMRTELPTIGKVSSEIFDEIILPQLGRKRPEILMGPRHGVDVGVVDLGHGQVMVTTTDPIFVVPPYGWERSGWFAVHILASDAATSGIRPNYITMDLNLPLSITRDEFEALWGVMHRECDKIGMAVVSGHTGRYEGCEYPMIGGATVICIGPRDRYVTPDMARPGDVVILTKGAAIEAAGLFAVTFPKRVAERYGEQAAREAEEIFWQMSIVEDAFTAVEAGVREDGVTAMHDATECGVWGGLFEVAQASGVGMTIDKGKIIVQAAVRNVCDLFGIDPYSSISEGTLILTCKPHKAKEVVRRLGDKGIPASMVGEIVDPRHGMRVFENGTSHELIHPKVDPFWAAFGKAASQGG